MKNNLLNALSMAKYARLLPRVFPGCDLLELRGMKGELVWAWHEDENREYDPDAVVAWSDFGNKIGRRTMPDGRTQFRSGLLAREKGESLFLMRQKRWAHWWLLLATMKMIAQKLF